MADRITDRLERITGPAGRALGVAQWGHPGGVPVFARHGTPGSRLGRIPDEANVRAAGLRLVTYDRPGYGASDRLPGRRIADCVADVAAARRTFWCRPRTAGGWPSMCPPLVSS